jgi:hypothetical protein
MSTRGRMERPPSADPESVRNRALWLAAELTVMRDLIIAQGGDEPGAAYREILSVPLCELTRLLIVDVSELGAENGVEVRAA